MVFGQTQKHRKEEGEIVDAKPHRNSPIDSEILGLVKVEEVTEASHPIVRFHERNECRKMWVICERFVAMHVLFRGERYVGTL